MKDKKWVQHISGQGEKWEVIGQGGRTSALEQEWTVDRAGYCFNLPKSEYVECEQPERWEDVTGECKVGTAVPEGNRGTILYEHDGGGCTDILNPCQFNDYRLRKIQLREEISYQGQWAFKIERKVS